MKNHPSMKIALPFAFALTLIGVAAAVARAQTCLCSHVTYFVRDEKGAPINETVKDLSYATDAVSRDWSVGWADFRKESTEQSKDLPKSILTSHAKLATLAARGCCAFDG